MPINTPVPFTLLELCAYSLPDHVLEKTLNDYDFPMEIDKLRNSCCKIIVNVITNHDRSSPLSPLSSLLQSSYTNRLDLLKFLQKFFYDEYHDDDDTDYPRDVCLRCLRFLYNIQCSVDADDDCTITYSKFDVTHHCNGSTHSERMRLYWFWSSVSVEILKFGRIECLEFLHKTCGQFQDDFGGLCASIIQSGSIACFEYARSVNLIKLRDYLATIISCIYYDKMRLLRHILQHTENVVDVIKKHEYMWDFPVLRLYHKCIKYGSVDGMMHLIEFGILLDNLTCNWRLKLMNYVKSRFVKNSFYKKYEHYRLAYEKYESSSLDVLRTRVSPYSIAGGGGVDGDHGYVMCNRNVVTSKSLMQKNVLRTKCLKLLQNINVDLDIERIKCLEFLQRRYGTDDYDFNVVIKFMRNCVNDFNKTFVPF